MARYPKLIASLLLAAVLAAHWLTLGWLQAQWQGVSLLQPMATPMLTRMLLPQAPLPTASLKRKPAPEPARIAQYAIQSIANELTPTAAAASAALSLPEESASPPVAQPGASAPEFQVLAAAESPPTAAISTATAAVPAPAKAAVDWPVDTRLSYQMRGWYRGEFAGAARVLWQRQDNRYQVRLEVDIGPFNAMTMTSQGEVSASGLRPAIYEEARRGKPRTLKLGEQDITLDDNSRVPRPEGVQDTVSQFVELAWRFGNGFVPQAPGNTVTFWLARPGGVDRWTYDVTERVTLQTARLGPVEAFHLVPQPLSQPRGNITAEMWFAPSLQHLPVRIRINQGSDIHMDLLIDKIEQTETQKRP